MAETSETFVVKPTLFMVLMSEKGSNNIRKIYFAFRDLHFWSIELEGESVVAIDGDGRNYKTILKADEQSGLIQHSMLGEVPFLPNEEVSKLFHALWGKAVDDEDYDKKEWKELSRILYERGYDV